MATPVQIVLNANNFSEDRDVPSGRGNRTDFFQDNESAFPAHREKIAAQLEGVAEEIRRNMVSFGEVGHVKVILRRRAWAKSHRPLTALFPNDRTPLVGGLDLGELILEVTPRSLDHAAGQVRLAEDRVKWEKNKITNKLEAHPTARRSETGAIERIEIYGAADRRRFDIEKAVVWLSNSKTGGQYEVELFDSPPPQGDWDATGVRQRLYVSFLKGLQGFGSGLTVNRLADKSSRSMARVSVRLERSSLPPRVQITGEGPAPNQKFSAPAPFDDRVERHMQVLKFLESHPLVKRIELPGILVPSAVASRPSRTLPSGFVMPVRDTGRRWPRVGVIDGGISDAALGDWLIGRWDQLADGDIDARHGTFIGGLLVAGSTLNGPDTCADPDGTEIYDVAVLPSTDTAFTTYHGDLNGFFEQVEYAIIEARTRHNVRIFNFSMNVQTLVASNNYSKIAERLDQIADTHDVLICISAGNLTTSRQEWSADVTSVLQMMAVSQNDGIFIPAESARNISVGALNPASLDGAIGHVPANYSRRGPGIQCLVKPDFAHVGGCGHGLASKAHGHYSVDPSGNVTESCGTSFAAPLLAKQAALLDAQIEGNVSRETLIALLTHHAKTPSGMGAKELSVIGRQLVGHGTPPSVGEILDGDDSQITLVFAARLMPGKQLKFEFAWPACLVENGRCRGKVRLTLVASPPLDQRFGAEFVRVNVEAALQQEAVKDGKHSWKGQLKPLYLPESSVDHPVEAERIEHGLKWSPVKVYGDQMPQGRGSSSTWRLLVSYLSRTDNTAVPQEGIPFTAILTIEDMAGEEPVFNVMRQQLAASPFQISDIRTAARVTTRV
ncbi:S8 family peptidase [Mesorhizobium sp. VK22B]|uniref:S8 family peptidase n=1 Tax=Mesorhizobium captivum TaxID=3072319 RepID=A0ABU4ZBD9_9HYPH|nr:S8 family peptidase [Mesorhizobium sp. VK22B]MDX8496615.1 S8 family peptidase [Mesorhizobium sp. VK22B]